MKRALATLLVSFALVGCAAQRAYDQGLELLQAGRLQEGLAKIEEASRRDPRNQIYRQALFRHRDAALQRELAAAELARQQGKWDLAEAAYGRMLAIDPRSARGRAGLEAVRRDRQDAERLAAAAELLKKGELDAAQSKAREVIADNPSHREAQLLLRKIEDAAGPTHEAPRLSAVLREPVKLDFRDATLKQVFEVISRQTGIDFIFDREVRLDQRTTVFVRNSSIDDVMRFLLITNQLERKILGENMLLIYPNTPQKQRDYQELIARTFYISNGDVKSIANMIRAVVKTRDLHIDEKLGAIIMRDTADAVRMAERLVANLDIADAEVVLELEVLEVGANTLYDLGIQYPDKLSISVVGAGGTPGTLTLPEWRSGRADLVRITVSDPLFALNFRNTLGQSNLLANPRVRVRNKEKAKVHIGDKVPVVTTTTTATGFASESVTYLEVGLKLEVEPTVSLDDEVGIKVGLEVSSIAREIRTNTGGLTYQVGTRNANTVLRLKDGETQVLAGLISDEERKSVTQVPGLGSLPILGRLFGSHSDTSTRTEIVLLMTPRVVRNLARPESRYEKFASGTEAAIGARPFALQSAALAQPADAAKPAPRPAAPTEVTLQSPPTAAYGEQFTVSIMVKGRPGLERGSLEIAFDPSRLRFIAAQPGALLVGANKDPEFRANAPEGEGRVSIAFAAKTGMPAAGELAALTFQVASRGPGNPLVRLESLSLTDAAGQSIPATPPPPLTFSVVP